MSLFGGTLKCGFRAGHLHGFIQKQGAPQSRDKSQRSLAKHCWWVTRISSNCYAWLSTLEQHTTQMDTNGVWCPRQNATQVKTCAWLGIHLLQEMFSPTCTTFHEVVSFPLKLLPCIFLQSRETFSAEHRMSFSGTGARWCAKAGGLSRSNGPVHSSRNLGAAVYELSRVTKIFRSERDAVLLKKYPNNYD